MTLSLFDILFEMPIKTFKTIGDWGRESSFKSPVDRKLLTHPKAIEKIKTQWNKTPYDFDIYLVNDKRVNREEFREVGEVDLNFVRNKLKLTKEELPDPPENVITIIYTNNRGANRYMASGWILAHRLGHALRLGESSSSWHWNEFTDSLEARFREMLKEIYGIDLRNSYGVDSSKLLKHFAEHLGTMKTARDKNLTSWFEFAYELLAQYLITGKIVFNPIPRSIMSNYDAYGSNKKTANYSQYEDARKQYNEELLPMFAQEFESNLEAVLGASLNSIFVM